MKPLDKDLIAWWKPKLRALDPWREISAEEIDVLYAERQAAPHASLATDLAVAESPAEVKVLLCGARGSGKSTELTRLAREVGDHFCVVHTDLAAGLPKRASTLALVTLLGVAALHALKIWSEPDPEIAALVKADRGVAELQDKLQTALSKFGDAVPKIAQLLGKISGIVTVFSPSAAATLEVLGAGVQTAAKITTTAASVNDEVQHALARGPLEGLLSPKQRDDAKAVVDTVNDILDELARLSGRSPLLLADGLDKRTGVEEVKLALNDEHLLRDLRSPLVLTGPVNLRHDPRFRAIPGNLRLALLYNVPVCARADNGAVESAQDGIDVLYDLYERRRVAAGIDDSLIAKEAVERAAHMCAGIVRDFLWLLHTACKGALNDGRRSTSLEDVEAAIKIKRLELQGYLNQGHVDVLHTVLRKGVLPAGEDADTLLFENFIACYPNGDLWFRPHEVIVDYVERNHANDRHQR